MVEGERMMNFEGGELEVDGSLVDVLVTDITEPNGKKEITDTDVFESADELGVEIPGVPGDPEDEESEAWFDKDWSELDEETRQYVREVMRKVVEKAREKNPDVYLEEETDKSPIVKIKLS